MPRGLSVEESGGVGINMRKIGIFSYSTDGYVTGWQAHTGSTVTNWTATPKTITVVAHCTPNWSDGYVQ